MIDFSKIKGLAIPEGEVIKIECNISGVIYVKAADPIEPTDVTFTISYASGYPDYAGISGTHTVANGTTWQQFIESDAVSDHSVYSILADGKLLDNPNGEYLRDSNMNPVLATDTIVDGDYQITSGATGVAINKNGSMVGELVTYDTSGNIKITVTDNTIGITGGYSTGSGEPNYTSSTAIGEVTLSKNGVVIGTYEAPCEISVEPYAWYSLDYVEKQADGVTFTISEAELDYGFHGTYTVESGTIWKDFINNWTLDSGDNWTSGGYGSTSGTTIDFYPMGYTLKDSNNNNVNPTDTIVAGTYHWGY